MELKLFVNHLNNISEKSIRPQWKITETPRQKAELVKLQNDLDDLGPELKTSEILNIVTYKLFGTDPYWEKLIKQVWDAFQKQIPSIASWEYPPQMNMSDFITALENAIQNTISSVFNDHKLKIR